MRGCYVTIGYIGHEKSTNRCHRIATIVAYIIPDERRGEGISYYSMSISLASSIGPLIGMNLYQHVSFYAILLLCLISVVIIFITTLFLKVPND